MENMIVDIRGLKDKEQFMKVRDALGCCTDEQMIDVLAGSHAQAKKIMSFMMMSGCVVEMVQSEDGWLLKMTGRSCRCG
ncbi:MAG: hypothetical protein M0Z61_04095 [Nitrospiraceae bacterium]|nr:hypothetical protein [Nitrospiraceae bacterium]